MDEIAAVLRGRDFRRLFTTRLVSQLSDGVFQAALAGFVFFSPEQETSPAKAAAAFAVLLLPYSVVGPFAGVYIDRWSRRQILKYAPLVRAAFVGVIAALLAGHHDGVPFYIAALVVLGVNRFFLSALSAALPHVVDKDDLVLANTISVTSGTVIAFVGAGIGYLLRLIFGGDAGGTAIVLLWCAAAYVLASASAAAMARDLLGPSPTERSISPEIKLVLRGLVAGARHIAERRQAACALAAISLHRFLYGVILIMAALLYRNTFTDSATAGLGGFSLFLGVNGAGFLIGALLTPSAVRRAGIRGWTVALLALAAAATLLTGAPFSQPLFLLYGLVLGMVSQGVKLCADTTIQSTVDDDFRGRVFAVYDMLFNATFVAAAAAAAAVLPQSGKSYAVLLAITGAYSAACVIYTTAARTPSHQPVHP